MESDEMISEVIRLVEEQLSFNPTGTKWKLIQADMGHLDSDSRTEDVTCVADLATQEITYYVNADYDFTKISIRELYEISLDETMFSIGEAYVHRIAD